MNLYLQEIKDTLDKEALYRIMGECFEIQQVSHDRTKIKRLISSIKCIRHFLQSYWLQEGGRDKWKGIVESLYCIYLLVCLNAKI